MRQYTPSRVYHPTIPLIDDSDVPAAATFNPGPEALADNVQFTITRSAFLAGVNWEQGVRAWSTMGNWNGTLFASAQSGAAPAIPTTAPVWDPVYGVWRMGITNGSNFVDGASGISTPVPIGFAGWIAVSPDGRNWWAEYGPIEKGIFSGSTGTFDAVNVTGIVTRASDGVTIAVVGPGQYGPPYALTGYPLPNAYLAVLTPTVGSYVVTNVTPSTTFNATPANQWWSGVYLGGFWIMWLGSSNTAAGAPVLSTDAVNWSGFATWTPPAGFTISNEAWAWNGGTTLLLFPAQATGGSSSASYMALTSGVGGLTWSAQALPTLGAGEYVSGSSYDSANGVFVLLTTTQYGIHAGGLSHVWTSPTGLAGTWTLVSTFQHPGHLLACGSDGEWVSMVNVCPSTTGAHDFFRDRWTAVQSYDQGVTWHLSGLTDFALFSPSTANSGDDIALVSNGSQFVFRHGRSGYAATMTVGQVTILNTIP